MANVCGLDEKRPCCAGAMQAQMAVQEKFKVKFQ